METYIKILELAKKKEGWSERIEELKFGCFLKTRLEIVRFVRKNPVFPIYETSSVYTCDSVDVESILNNTEIL
jgi:hypothetical protein